MSSAASKIQIKYNNSTVHLTVGFKQVLVKIEMNKVILTFLSLSIRGRKWVLSS